MHSTSVYYLYSKSELFGVVKEIFSLGNSPTRRGRQFAYKAGKAKADKYGNLLTDETVRKLYPIFNGKYMFKTAKDWILKGDWDENLLNIEIAEIKSQKEAAAPKDILRTYCLLDIDEDIMLQGFPTILDMAYTGQLSLDEYINLYIIRIGPENMGLSCLKILIGRRFNVGSKGI